MTQHSSPVRPVRCTRFNVFSVLFKTPIFTPAALTHPSQTGRLRDIRPPPAVAAPATMA